MVHSYPPDYIPLGEAFENGLLKLEKVCRNVEVIGENEFWQRTSAEMGVAASSFDDSEPRRRVELLMRDAIIEWKLRPYRMDPATGQIQLIYIDPNEWMKMSFFPGLESVDEEGVLRRLKISEFEEWLHEAQAVQSDEAFEKVSQEAGGVSSSEPAAQPIAQVTEPAPSPPWHRERTAGGTGDRGCKDAAGCGRSHAPRIRAAPYVSLHALDDQSKIRLQTLVDSDDARKSGKTHQDPDTSP